MSDCNNSAIPKKFRKLIFVFNHLIKQLICFLDEGLEGQENSLIPPQNINETLIRPVQFLDLQLQTEKFLLFYYNIKTIQIVIQRE